MQSKEELNKIELGEIVLPNLAAFDVVDGDTVRHGGNQDWYADEWQQQAGCGPTTCANMLWYLAQTDEDCKNLCTYDAGTKAGFVFLMEEVWQNVTPSAMGVNTTDIFVDGAEKYAKTKGITLTGKALQIKSKYNCARSYSTVFEFVREALQNKKPVAFLNLSNGSIKGLDDWHWVCIVAQRGNEVLIYDQGEAKWIDLQEWHASTFLGGGLVSLEKA